jgi:prefoldin subunit 5
MQEKLDLDQEKALLHSKKLKLLNDKSCNSPRVLKQDSDRQTNIFDLSPVNTSGDVVCGSSILFESKSGENGKDFDLAYIELSEQIEKINKDFDVKEQSLQQKEAELAELSQVLNEKFHQNSMIFQCLSQSKSYIDEFNSQTLTEFECNSQLLVDLITSLKSQKAELELLTEKVHKQLTILKTRPTGLDVIKEEPSESLELKLSEEPETLDTESE